MKRIKKLFQAKLLSLSAACLIAMLMSATSHAAVIDEDLQQAMLAGGDVRFIVQFADRVDVRDFPGKGHGIYRCNLNQPWRRY